MFANTGAIEVVITDTDINHIIKRDHNGCDDEAETCNEYASMPGSDQS